MVEATSVRAAAGTGLLVALVSTTAFGATVGAVSALDAIDRSPRDDDANGPVSAVDRLALAAIATSSTVQVRASACGVTTRGSGVVMGASVWTAAHVVAGADEIRVARADFDALGTPDLVLGGRDLAVLELGGFRATAAAPELRTSELEVGERVIVAGHPEGGPLELVETTLHHVDLGTAWGFDGPAVLLDGAAAPGTSGGPVFDTQGRLIGLVHGYEATTGLTVVSPVAIGVETGAENEAAATEPNVGGTSC